MEFGKALDLYQKALFELFPDIFDEHFAGPHERYREPLLKERATRRPDVAEPHPLLYDMLRFYKSNDLWRMRPGGFVLGAWAGRTQLHRDAGEACIGCMKPIAKENFPNLLPITTIELNWFTRIENPSDPRLLADDLVRLTAWAVQVREQSTDGFETAFCYPKLCYDCAEEVTWLFADWDFSDKLQAAHEAFFEALAKDAERAEEWRQEQKAVIRRDIRRRAKYDVQVDVGDDWRSW